jgi:hypothetical protein
MIHTDGKRTIANAGPIPGQLDLVTELKKIVAPLTTDEQAKIAADFRLTPNPATC